jgi:hypothetical protein
MTGDVGDPGDRRASRAPPPLPPPWASQIGVDLRGVHPKPSQIGVDFSDPPSLWRRFQSFPLCSFVSFVVKGVGSFWLIASCLFASYSFCQISDAQGTLQPKAEYHNLPFVRPWSQ